jgi:tetratricopeptide (TPR) repeat protein
MKLRESTMTKKPLLFLFATMLLCGKMSFAQQDTVSYKAASALQNTNDRLSAFGEFLKLYPTSKLKPKVYDALFQLYLDRDDSAAAINAASGALAAIAPDARMNQYNRFANALAESNCGLDSALVWVTHAEEMAQAGNSRSLSAIQDTRAYVLYRRGSYAEAEKLQRVAIVGNEDDPEYLNHMALYEKENGKLSDALRTMTKALYLGGDEEGKARFEEWIALIENEKPKQEGFKESVVMGTVHQFIDTLKGSKLIAARSNAAGLMAELNVDLPIARIWAEEACASLSKNSLVSDVALFTQSEAKVSIAENRHDEALKQLRSTRDLVDPYDTKFWTLLGRTYEQAGDRSQAIGAYMQGLTVLNDRRLRTTLEAAFKKAHGSLAGLDNAIDSVKQANTNFDPGHYGRSTTPEGKVMLVELFTGAECGPCVGADMALDALSEHYPRTVVALVEYHVHIPGPDPLTTNESWDRYKMYSGQGTPTVVVEGKESIVGGGSKASAKNRFGLYRYVVEKFTSDKPQIALAISVKSVKSDVEGKAVVKADVVRTVPLGKSAKPALHLALVERSVDYTGSNGISKHLFVVRRMVGGAQGISLDPTKQRETITKVVDFNEVEKAIKALLDNPTTQPSWSTRRPFAGWRTRPEKLDRANLAIVGWVQDKETKEVLQAIYQDVP